MADKVRFILSSKVGKSGKNAGKSEVIVKMYLTRTIRLQVKSGVFVNPKFFADSETGICVPKLGKLNAGERADASESKMALDALVLRLTTLQDVIVRSGNEVTRELFLDALHILDSYDVSTEEISIETIEALFKKEQDAVKAVEAEPVEVEEKPAESIYDTIETFLRVKDSSDNYTKQLRVIMRSMARYELFCQMTGGDRKDFAWDIHTVTRDDIEDFVVYLRTEDELVEQYPHIFEKILEQVPLKVKGRGNQITGRGGNTIIKTNKRLKQFFKWCNETGRTTNQPYQGYTIGMEHFGTPYYITIEERNMLADFDFSARPGLAVQRDIFIFQCLVGCRVGDLVTLTPANIHGDILEYVPHKTKDDAMPVKPRVPLNPRAQALIEKYKGKDRKGRLFPFISTQKYNVAIKEMFTLAGLTRIVPVRNAKTGETEMHPLNEVASSHMARRTFVGNTYKMVKDPNLVGKMSGHVEGSKAFNRYRQIDDDDLRSVINLIE